MASLPTGSLVYYTVTGRRGGWRSSIRGAAINRHLGVSPGLSVVLDESDVLDRHRPSASYLFRSVARSCGARALGVILIGIGADGSPGLVELKKAGGRVDAHDEATSVVHGMPGRTIETGAVDRVLSLDEIARDIIEVCRRGRRMFGKVVKDSSRVWLPEHDSS